MDPEVSAALKNYLEAEGVRVCAGVGYQRIAQTQSGVELTCEGHCDTVAAEQVLIATGRRPNSDGLGLEERGIVLARNGGIVVDDHLETSVPGIYAAGDEIGRASVRERAVSTCRCRWAPYHKEQKDRTTYSTCATTKSLSTRVKEIDNNIKGHK